MLTIVVVAVAFLVAPIHAAFGDVYSWGRGEEGALGHNNHKQQNRPMPIADLLGKNTKLVDAGATSSVAVTTDGKTYMWGRGVSKDGMLDKEASSDAPVMIKVLESIKVVQFTAGVCHYAVLTDHGEVLTWGCNHRGALGRGRMCPDCHSSVPQRLPALQGRNVRQIVSGGDHTAALTDNGEVWVWGSGEGGEIGNGQFADQADPQKVASLKDHRICQICAGIDHMAAVDTNGMLFSWGNNEMGQLGHGLNEQRIAEPRKVQRFKYPDTVAVIGCGMSYTSAITRSNKVFLWGAGGEPLPTEKVYFSKDTFYPRSLSAGQSHVVLVTKDNQVYTWGSNYQGQLGVNDERFFTLEPQLVEDLVGKHINMIAAGTNHTIALSGKPLPFMCPVFQDWYGAPGSSFGDFVAECHIEDETCPDGSCCRNGESCAQFADGRWGCCIGPNMRIVEDQLTCCPKESIFNSQDKTCEKPVSYAEAVRVLKAYEDGSLKKLPQVPSEVQGDDTLPSGSPVTIIEANVPVTSVRKTSESTYQESGASAASEAAVKEFHKITSEYAHATQAEHPKSDSTSAVSSSSSSSSSSSTAESITSTSSSSSSDTTSNLKSLNSEPSSMSSSSSSSSSTNGETSISTHASSGDDEDDYPTATPEDILLENRIRQDMANANSVSNDGKNDVFKMTRKEVVTELKQINEANIKHGQASDPNFENNLSVLADDELRSLLIDMRQNGAKPLTSKTQVMNEEGTAIMLPNAEAINREEQKLAAKAPSIEDIDEQEKTPEPLPVVEPDQYNTHEWKENVLLSRKLAGLPKSSYLSALGVLAPQPPPAREDPDVIPGASHIKLNKHKDSLLQAEAAESKLRSGSGPCPRTAGNLDCNRDCSEVDAKVIDAARDAAEALAAAGLDSSPIKQRIKSETELLSPSASPSPSPSASWVSRTIIQGNHTFIQEGNTTVAVDSVTVHVPPAGFYRDPVTNHTYKIIGDKVTMTQPAVRFASLGLSPGSEFRGHCGVSRPTCPDNSCCDEGHTCCQQQDGSFGCCPFEAGTCCVDQRHCCPAPYICDLLQQACVFNGSTIGLAKFSRVDQGMCEVNYHACKFGSCCENSQSCCQMFDGLEGCAPFQDATCCSDGKHACPDGSTCDLREGVCVDIMTGMTQPIGVLKHSVVPAGAHLSCDLDELTCSGGSCCPGENSCCRSSDGFESCCPFLDGECCGNGLCCPNGYSCDSDEKICRGAEGDAAMQATLPGRTPFILTDACNINENKCSGTNLCCGKGEACCAGLVSNNNNQTEVIHGCCPYGEDAVCCDDGTCCPYRSVCEVGGCSDPTGKFYEKKSILVARPSDVSDTLTCEDTRDLQDRMRDLLKQDAKSALIHQYNITNGTENPACPPYCDVTVQPDTGVWGSEAENAQHLKSAGEVGVHVDEIHDTLDVMEKEREKAQIIDEVEQLKSQLTHLSSNFTAVSVVRSSLTVSCAWEVIFRTKYGHMFQSAIAESAEVELEQVVLLSVRPGIAIDFSIDPIPPVQSQADLISQKLTNAFSNGFFASTLQNLGFSCGSVAVSQLPEVHHEPALDIPAKLQALQKLEELTKLFKPGVGEIQISPDLIASLATLRKLSEELQEIKKELSGANLKELEDANGIISVLEKLSTMILNLIRSHDGDNLSDSSLLKALLNSKTHKELMSLQESLKEARRIAKCQRSPNQQHPSPGCESTQMALTTMPLRGETDGDDQVDPLLQRQLGNSLRVPQGSQLSIDQNPPSIPLPDHSPYSTTEENGFWMPEGV